MNNCLFLVLILKVMLTNGNQVLEHKIEALEERVMNIEKKFECKIEDILNEIQDLANQKRGKKDMKLGFILSIKYHYSVFPRDIKARF